jgi:hypothetical protein
MFPAKHLGSGVKHAGPYGPGAATVVRSEVDMKHQTANGSDLAR